MVKPSANSRNNRAAMKATTEEDLARKRISVPQLAVKKTEEQREERAFHITIIEKTTEEKREECIIHITETTGGKWFIPDTLETRIATPFNCKRVMYYSFPQKADKNLFLAKVAEIGKGNDSVRLGKYHVSDQNGDKNLFLAKLADEIGKGNDSVRLDVNLVKWKYGREINTEGFNFRSRKQRVEWLKWYGSASKEYLLGEGDDVFNQKGKQVVKD